MPQHEMEAIRNVAFMGHGSCGKTTILEQFFAKAGLVSRPGSVDDGSSRLDFEDEEKARGFGIDSAMGRCEWESCHLNLLDVPGYPDFIGEVLGGLCAVETVAVTIAAPSGIELNTRRTWDAAGNSGKARMIVVNKMDSDNIDFDALLASIRETFGSSCVPVTLPVGCGSALSDVVNVLDAGDSAPEGVLGDLDSARSELIESVIETDEALMERYLEDEEISPDELQGALAQAVSQGAVVPILFVSGRTGVGIQSLMDTIAKVLPSPATAQPVKATRGKEDEEVEIGPDPSGPFVAQVFKLEIDPFVGKLVYIRVYSGTLAADASVKNARTRRSERIAQPMCMLGKEGEVLSGLVPGDIVAVGKLDDVDMNDTLYGGNDAITLPAIEFPAPMVALAVQPKSRNDEQRLSGALDKLRSEDATVQVGRDSQTHELVLKGMSSLHLEVILGRLKRRFNVEVNTKEPNIAYRETVSGKSEAKHRHKKQSGGRGQFAEVHLRMAPTERDAGFEFVDKVVGGVIPRQFIPAVEKGVREALGKGVVAGYPVHDVQATVFFGKHHPVDSSEAAFKLAASMAFRECLRQAHPVLLEPVVRLEVTAAAQYMGDITSDLSGRRGRIQGMEASGDMQTIIGIVPLAEVSRYATELRSLTGGSAFYTVEFSHYDVVPAHITEQIVKANNAAKEKDA